MDDGWYVGKLKEVPGIFSQGETLEELEENIRDAYSLMLEDGEEELQSRSKIQTKILEVTVGAKHFQPD
jgi:predicted RNase H-like HicB family nuclease